MYVQDMRGSAAAYSHAPEINGFAGQTRTEEIAPPVPVSPLAQARLAAAKRSYVTRRGELKCADRLILGRAPRAGDIALCRVLDIGQHAHLELVSGRRAKLFPGDEIIVAFGERYATDQFHSKIPADLSPCSLVAAGGIASDVAAKHAGMKRATRIEPLGLLGDHDGRVLNLADWALEPAPKAGREAAPTVILVVGSSMNAGKTTTAANIIRGLVRSNLKVAAMKLTGTGSGGDCWHFRDAGACETLDFTDAGLASTYRVPVEKIEQAGRLLVAELCREKPNFIVCEIADGLLQQETAALLRSLFIKEISDCVVFAAGDPISAAAGVHLLASHGIVVSAISGVVSSSPLAAAEAEMATGLKVLTLADLNSEEKGPAVFLQSAR